MGIGHGDRMKISPILPQTRPQRPTLYFSLMIEKSFWEAGWFLLWVVTTYASCQIM
ncbi:hypothetical protein [Microcoleus sp. FACHB-831]|uniref:hypothetical protein n=1 Tax=Microcoleus sp. FACHB-831 TaxID=2692827 RepID=UPI001A7ED6B8|nr:hypothetical protein [Microcoleus sp. FACHB-831]